MPKAALLTDFEKPLEIVDLEVPEPVAGEVRVRLASSGVCGSDQGLIDWRWTPLPVILGHEAAGVVEAVGDGVDGLAVGDHVVLASATQCGECFFCSKGDKHLCDQTGIAAMVKARREGVAVADAPPEALVAFTSRYTVGGDSIYRMMWTGTFAEEVLVPARAAVKIDKAVPLEVASLLGCAVITGVGAALNGAQIRAGDTVAVVGAGGVGLNAVQGARIAGAERIIAVDVTPWKLELAKTFGATDTVDSSGTDPVEAVQALTGGYGADVSIEAVNQHHGGPVATDHAFRMTRNGGQVVLVGGAGVAIPNGFIAQGKIVRGVLYGNADLERDFDKLGRLYLDGQLLLDELATRRLPIEGINDAFDAMRAGEVARSLLVYR